jgi:hypothetical protein
VEESREGGEQGGSGPHLGTSQHKITSTTFTYMKPDINTIILLNGDTFNEFLMGTRIRALTDTQLMRVYGMNNREITVFGGQTLDALDITADEMRERGITPQTVREELLAILVEVKAAFGGSKDHTDFQLLGGNYDHSRVLKSKVGVPVVFHCIYRSHANFTVPIMVVLALGDLTDEDLPDWLKQE